MKHRISHKKLSRDTNARRALLKNLATSLVLHERIVTTTAKAKAIRPFVEKLITKAKEDSLGSRRYLSAKLDKETAVEKMLELVGPTFKGRPGGYTRVVKLSPRGGDRADQSLVEFVENISEVAAKKKLAKKKSVANAKKESVKETTKTKVIKPKTKTNVKSKQSKSKTAATKKTKAK